MHRRKSDLALILSSWLLHLCYLAQKANIFPLILRFPEFLNVWEILDFVVCFGRGSDLAQVVAKSAAVARCGAGVSRPWSSFCTWA
jgi:hypothetical protein